MHVPDAVYFILKEHTILSVDLSNNHLTKMPRKMGKKLRDVRGLLKSIDC